MFRDRRRKAGLGSALASLGALGIVLGPRLGATALGRPWSFLVGFGLGVVAGAAEGIRSANLGLVIPWWLVALTPAVMVMLCMLASLLALWRVARLEPGMVFR